MVPTTIHALQKISYLLSTFQDPAVMTLLMVMAL